MSVRLAVVGGGISGLTAAYRLRREFGPEVTIDLYEADDQPGGLLCTRRVGDHWMDLGAEAFIVRRPEAVDLVTELGLADEVVAPSGLRPAIWSGGRLHRLPAPALMGIPATAAVLGDLIDDADRRRIDDEAERELPWNPGTDCSVGELVADRFGPAVVARSVDPMLGGVYSARAHDLGLREAVPALAAALDAGAGSLTAAVAGVTGAATTAAGPVFGALRGGYRRLVQVLAGAGGARLHTGTEVTAVTADTGWTATTAGTGTTVTTATGWTVTTAAGEVARYAGVVVAVPAWTAGRLLGGAAPAAAPALSAVQPAGSAVVACVLAPGTALPEHSGVLVASDATDLRTKAVTLSSQKWPHLRDGAPLLRVSFGRLGEPVELGDDALTAVAVEDLAAIFAAVGLPAPEVTASAVQRWPGGLPHYAPGHLAAMTAAVDELPSGLALAGAALSGVGVPACIGAAGAAARKIGRDLPVR